MADKRRWPINDEGTLALLVVVSLKIVSKFDKKF